VSGAIAIAARTAVGEQRQMQVVLQKTDADGLLGQHLDGVKK